MYRSLLSVSLSFCLCLCLCLSLSFSLSLSLSPSPSPSLLQLPPGWRKGYCASKPFFVHNETGRSTWNIKDVFAQTGDGSSDEVSHPSFRVPPKLCSMFHLWPTQWPKPQFPGFSPEARQCFHKAYTMFPKLVKRVGLY